MLTNGGCVGAAQVAPAGTQAKVALPRRHEAFVLQAGQRGWQQHDDVAANLMGGCRTT